MPENGVTVREYLRDLEGWRAEEGKDNEGTRLWVLY